jgi:hypothetical protein
MPLRWFRVASMTCGATRNRAKPDATVRRRSCSTQAGVSGGNIVSIRRRPLARIAVAKNPRDPVLLDQKCKLSRRIIRIHRPPGRAYNLYVSAARKRSLISAASER